MKSSAYISECGKYRYNLIRDWSEGAPVRTVVFIGLNPSTADATKDDPTIRRCIGYARAWGFNRLVMVNLFAFRATEPTDMKKAQDPVGFHNWAALLDACSKADLVVAAWGTHGEFKNMGQLMKEKLQPLHHLGLTKAGHPKHPLYLRADVKPEPLC